MAQEEPQVECSICGRNGQPPQLCDLCHGNAPVQSREYTLSDHRAGRAPEADRYGTDGGLNPKSSPFVVGGAVNHPSHRQ
jgi:hypothetical protein